MKAKIFLFFIFLLPFRAFSAGEQDEFERLCSNVKTLSGIAQQLTVVPWQTIVMTPSGPIPTVTMAAISDRGGMTEFCAVYHHLKHAEGADLVFGGLQQLDKMHEGKNNKKISLARNLFDNSTAIHRATTMNGDTLSKMNRIAGRLNSSFKNVNSLVEEVEGEDPRLFITREQQESSQRKQIELAKNITMITSAIRCENNSKTVDEGNKPKFLSDSQIKQEELGYIESDIDFLIMTLQRMAIKFINSNGDFENLKKDLGYLTKESVKFQVREDQRSVTKIVDIEKKGKLEPGESKYEKKEVKSTQDYQVFKTITDANIEMDFLKKYQKRWDNYIESFATDKLKGILTRKLGGHEEEKFYDNAFECRASLMYRKAKESNPGFFLNLNDSRRGKAISEQRAQCRNELKNIDRNISLFKRYTNELVLAVIKQKGLQGDLWTIDSFYNGTIRIERGGSVEDSTVYAMEDLGCKDKRSTAEQKEMKLETTRQIGELRQTLLQEKIKQNELLEQKILAEQKMKEEMKIQSSIEAESRSRNAIKQGNDLSEADIPGI